MQAKEPLKTAFLMLPWLFGGTVSVVLALVLLKAELTAWWPAWLQAAVVLTVGLAVAAVVHLFLVPNLRARILKGGHIGEVRRPSPPTLRAPKDEHPLVFTLASAPSASRTLPPQ